MADDKDLEIQYEEIKKRFGTFANVGPFILMYLTPNYELAYVNQNFFEYFPFDQEKSIGKRLEEIVGKESFAALRPSIEKALQGKSCNFEAVLSFPHGKSYFDENCIPDFDEKNNVKGVIAFLTDTTEKKFVETALEESYDRQLHTVKSLDVGIWDWLDIQSDTVYWSSKLFELLGYDPNEIEPSASFFISQVHPEDQPKIFGEKDMHEVFAENPRHESEFRVKTKSGEYRWFRHSMIAVKNDQGEFRRIVGASRDIHDEKLTRNRMNLFKEIFETSPDYIFTFLPNGEVIEMNQRYREALNIGPNENLDNVWGRVDPDERDLFFNVAIPAVKENGIWQHETELKGICENGLHVNIIVSGVFDDLGNLQFLTSVMRDISDSKRMQEQIEIERAKAFQSSRLASLGEMAAGVAHEINNPLAILMGAAHNIEKLLKRGDLTDEKLEHFVGMSKKTIKRIARIVSGLLRFSNRGEAAEDLLKFSLSSLVANVIDMCSEKFMSRGVQVLLSDFDGDQEVVVNRVQMEQVLLNLFNNSFDAISDLENKWIRLSTEVVEDTILLRVQDSGSGIPENIREKIMEPFFSTKEVGKGTGLGLSISKTIMESMKGDLNYNSESRHTEFVLQLQLAIANKQSDDGKGKLSA